MRKKKLPFIVISILLFFIIIILLAFLLIKPCSSCGEDGIIRCTNCSKGVVDCENCAPNGELLCTICYGKGEIRCSSCNSRGYTTGGTCPECNGDGRLITSLDLSDVPDSGVMNIYKNPRRGTAFWSFDCWDCDGSGVEHIECSVCRGYGNFDCQECAASGYIGTCTECGGAAELTCTKCEGTRTLVCSNCRGTGKRFIWN